MYKDNKEASSKAERYKAELQALREKQANAAGRLAQPQEKSEKSEKIMSDVTDARNTVSQSNPLGASTTHIVGRRPGVEWIHGVDRRKKRAYSASLDSARLAN